MIGKKFIYYKSFAFNIEFIQASLTSKLYYYILFIIFVLIFRISFPEILNLNDFIKSENSPVSIILFFYFGKKISKFLLNKSLFYVYAYHLIYVGIHSKCF